MSRASFKAILKMSVLSLKDHKIRSALALLGIVVGISALITTVSIGRGAEEEVKEQVLAMGDNYIFIQSGIIAEEGKVQRLRSKQKPLTFEDFRAIELQTPNIRAISPIVQGKKPIKHRAEKVLGYVKGGNEKYMSILERPLAKGTPITKFHVKTAEKVAVLGSRTASDLFGNTNPVGQVILIEDIPFVVIGVLEKKKTFRATIQDPNLDVFVPISSIQRKLIPTYQNGIQGIVMSLAEKERSQQTVTTLRRILRFRHLLQKQYPDDFVIWDQQALLKASTRAYETLNVFLLSAAGVALLVGGIGIMNIMLVATTERKREIGIRMAIGASPNAILQQFLVESVILCLIGGVIGICIGIIAPYMIQSVTELPAILELTPILLGAITSLVVGITFGFYPAYKASKLNPVDALQYQ